MTITETCACGASITVTAGVGSMAMLAIGRWREGHKCGNPEGAGTVLARVREALAGHPRCDERPDDGPIACGWKKAVASVQWALEGA